MGVPLHLAKPLAFVGHGTDRPIRASPGTLVSQDSSGVAHQGPPKKSRVRFSLGFSGDCHLARRRDFHFRAQSHVERIEDFDGSFQRNSEVLVALVA